MKYRFIYISTLTTKPTLDFNMELVVGVGEWLGQSLQQY